MIIIDGSEAGGQLVRTATALSALTGKAVEIKNIRGARSETGLKIQHIEGIRAIGELCDAKISGLKEGSTILKFEPKKLEAKDLNIEITTAGSIGLILQTLMIPISYLDQPIKITINGGGTWNKWAPPVEYFERIMFPILGENSKIKIIKNGFYPKGGAKIEIFSRPFEITGLDLLDKGNLILTSIKSIASRDLELRTVAERQAEAAKKLIEEKLKCETEIITEYVEADNPGSGIILWTSNENSIIGGDSLGELKKKAEDVGKEAAEKLIEDYKNGCVDRHAADMLLPYMALVGSGKIKAPSITDHMRHNAKVIEMFLPVKFTLHSDGLVEVRS